MRRGVNAELVQGEGEGRRGDCVRDGRRESEI